MLRTNSDLVSPASRTRPLWRGKLSRALSGLVLLVCLVLLVRVFFIDIYEVQGPSMHPAFSGPHFRLDCTRCGWTAKVAHQPSARRKVKNRAWCSNCGGNLPNGGGHRHGGARVLVDRSAYLFQLPQRWQVIVFRIFGVVVIKRIVALPGEHVEIKDGDVYINKRLARKTWAELEPMMVPVFDMEKSPSVADWRKRWPTNRPTDPHPLANRHLFLDASEQESGYLKVEYCNYFVDERKSAPIRDEYTYNNCRNYPANCVHDFILNATLEIGFDAKWVVLQICDGGDRVAIEIPVMGGKRRIPGRLTACPTVAVNRPLWVSFLPGKCYDVMMALVDRRFTLRAAGRTVTVDLPPNANRAAVIRPITIGVKSGKLLVSKFRLSRDVHYSQDGRHALAGQPVHLPVGQYFVLGDNSPASDDSRYWPSNGCIRGEAIIGRPIPLGVLPSTFHAGDR